MPWLSASGSELMPHSEPGAQVRFDPGDHGVGIRGRLGFGSDADADDAGVRGQADSGIGAGLEVADAFVEGGLGVHP